MYADSAADGGLWRYRSGGWTRVGETGAAFGTRGERLYRLDKNRSAVWEWAGADWHRISGPVGSLVVTG